MGRGLPGAGRQGSRLARLPPRPAAVGRPAPCSAGPCARSRHAAHPPQHGRVMSASLDLAHRDSLAPVPAAAGRPRWSVMIPTYRSEATLAATIESVLAEPASRGSMQIEVVDDASDDDA